MKTLLLIDANALVHRSFHALPPLTTPEGAPIGAIYGISSTLLKIFRDQKPDYAAAAFDRPEPTFRKEMFAEYKAHRPPAADELISQIIKAHELMEKFGVPIFEKAGFEGDDIIGTLVNIFRKEPDLKIIILTGDLDTLQLVEDNHIVVQNLKKGISETFIYDDAAVIERYGLKPSQMTDYKGLVGDPSDNIPGIKGIGPKSAEKLLNEFGTLENVFKKIKPENSLYKKISDGEEKALFSKKLATIKQDVPLEVKLNDLKYNELKTDKIIKYFTELGFQSLVDRVFKQQEFFVATPKTETKSAEIKNTIFITNLEKTAKKDLQSNKLKVAYGWHDLFKSALSAGIEIKQPIFDLKIAGWLLDPESDDLSLESLSRRFLRKNANTGDEEILKQLFVFFNKKLDEYGLRKVFEEIDIPLLPILAQMENWGVKVSSEKLKELKNSAEKELEELTKKIYELAGKTFNINSPKQLGQVLFEKLKIDSPKIRKTAGGARSTAEQALSEIRNEHPIVGLILEYRETFKIKSTYFEPLLEMIQLDGRVRTSFLETGTATGRLSSEKPNMQNIPQSSKWAPLLREAFESRADSSLLTLDYSQLELRILAVIANDEKMKAAFLANKDIHQITASQVFKTPFQEVTPELRRLAKTLNFGIVYGMGATAFAEQSGLPRSEAQKFINEYFADFPEIKIWQEKTKAEARAFGFVANLNGRRRWFKEILTGNPRLLAEAERKAINMPIQSLGADIIKLAMIKTAKYLETQKLWGDKVKMILSIHDELLFEVRDDILMKVCPLIKKMMENVLSFSIPLKVDAKYGKSWGSMKKLEG
ncbi:MAG: DNA polymerase [Patescibacteria group bacterium]